MSEYFQPVDLRYSQCDLIALTTHCRLLHPVVSLTLSSAGVYEPTAETASIGLAELRSAMAIIATADCDMDKKNTKFWHICPVHPIALLAKPDQTNVRKNKLVKFLHLPGYQVIPESFVDFSSLTTISPDVVKSGSRLATLSDVGRKAFYLQFTRWITRWTLEDISCPSCSTQFNPADTLPIRSE